MRGGNASFWFDRWLALGPLSVRIDAIQNNMLKIKDFWSANIWDYERMVALVGEDIIAKILQHIPLGREGSNVSFWKPSKDVLFSLASAWEVVQVKAELL